MGKQLQDFDKVIKAFVITQESSDSSDSDSHCHIRNDWDRGCRVELVFLKPQIFLLKISSIYSSGCLKLFHEKALSDEAIRLLDNYLGLICSK